MPSYLSNAETVEQVIKLGETKAHYSVGKTTLLGFMGGLYIALAALGNLIACYYIDGGMGRFIGASIFPVGLMLVVLIGGSLFTGDVLETMALTCKKMTFKKYISNIGCVWSGNFMGAVFVVFVTYLAGSFADVDFAKFVVGIAEHKLHLTPTEALFSAFLCNILVALSVWFALACDDLPGKILAIWFPIMLFVFAGFQHIVANMFYLNIGILLSPELYEPQSYVTSLAVVTLGNFLSGGLFLPLIYKKLYIHKKSY